MSPSVVAINAAYLLLIAASFSRGLVRLRLLLITAAVSFVIFGLLRGVTAMVVWNGIIAVMHGRKLASDLIRRRRLRLSEDEEQVRETFFADLATEVFAVLWRAGSEVIAPENELIIGEGAANEEVFLVLAGKVEVQRAGQVITSLGSGSVIGEMSRSSGGRATADCFATETVLLHRWHNQDLEGLGQRSPNAMLAFEQLVSRDLAAKLTR